MPDANNMPDANKTMLHIGQCRLCETGPLGLRRCGGCERVVVLCDECDATWTDANLTAPPRLESDGDLCCPHCDASLYREPSRWATRNECAAEAWLTKALDAGEFQLSESEPLGE